MRLGVAGRLYVVGGTAMALEFDTRRTTRDIEAVFHPPTTVADEAASMATDLGLPSGWLSAAAQAFIPLPDENPVSLDIEGLQVAVSSPANLLAMKTAAGRPQDMSDMVVLFRHLKIRRAGQAVDMCRADDRRRLGRAQRAEGLAAPACRVGPGQGARLQRSLTPRRLCPAVSRGSYVVSDRHGIRSRWEAGGRPCEVCGMAWLVP